MIVLYLLRDDLSYGPRAHGIVLINDAAKDGPLSYSYNYYYCVYHICLQYCSPVVVFDKLLFHYCIRYSTSPAGSMPLWVRKLGVL